MKKHFMSYLVIATACASTFVFVPLVGAAPAADPVPQSSALTGESPASVLDIDDMAPLTDEPAAGPLTDDQLAVIAEDGGYELAASPLSEDLLVAEGPPLSIDERVWGGGGSAGRLYD